LLPAGLDRLAAHCDIREGGLDADRERLLELAPGVDAIVADPTVAVDEALLEAAGAGLKIVANFAVGYDGIDLDACRRRGIAVTNTPDVLTNATAELALALTLAAARRVNAAESDLRAGRWIGWDPGGYLGLELSGAVFAIVGPGRIGRRYSELVRPMAGEILLVSRRDSLDEALRRADVVSLHVPATPETTRMIGRAELEAMKPDAILVNTARGSILDTAALAEALHARSVGAAGLDVYEQEPAVPTELLGAPRCVLLPHIGSATTRAREAMASVVADNVLAVLGGAEPPNRVA
jgi:glyoxylate reductase